MRKTPCLFERQWNDRSQRPAIDAVNPECQWVADGEGVATIKRDGTCCLVDDEGRLWARHAVKSGKPKPPGFMTTGDVRENGKELGWLPAAGPQYKHHRAVPCPPIAGTYELVGPPINANHEGLDRLYFVRHGAEIVNAPRTFDALADYLGSLPWEGLVFHHPDGRMAKIKRTDFGHAWPIKSEGSHG